MKINHLHLHGADPQQSRAFYERWFGFRQAWESDGATFLRDTDGFLLAIFPDKEEYAKIPSWFHFGYCIDSQDTVRALYQEMKAAGVRFSESGLVEHDDVVVFWALDPDNHKVEVRWEVTAG